jgi:hypothetical protein
VYVKQASDPQTMKGLLVDSKTYSVTAEATTKQDLYGTLSITVAKRCEQTKELAKAAVTPPGSEILEKLRAIHGTKKNSETDRLDIKPAATGQYSPIQEYDQIQGRQRVKYFYDECTLKNFETVKRPDTLAWRGSQTFHIDSSDLNALWKLKEDLGAKYLREVNDPNQLTVDVRWSATATLGALEKLGAQLEHDAFEKFMAHGSDFKCDAGKFSFACLSSMPVLPVGRGGGLQFGNPGSAPSAYSDGAGLDVDASERGVKKLTGKYSIHYTLRRVLVNNGR